MERNIIYAGVGTDLRKKLSKMRVEQNKPDLRSVDVTHTYFVDPDIPTDIHQSNTERKYIEDFIRNSILEDFTIFHNGIIESDRMIEHITIEQLYIITFPLMLNLVEHCNTTLSITYPSIDMVRKSLNDLNYNDVSFPLFEHELCNIEAIAFGDHKTLLNKSRIQNIINHYDLYNTKFNIEFSPVVMDDKEFYENVKITSKSSLITALSTPDTTKLKWVVHPKANIKDFIFEFNNKIEYDSARDSINPITYDRPLLGNVIHGYFKYIDIEKLHKCCSLGLSTGSFEYVYDNKFVEKVFTREGHFKTFYHAGIELLNKIDPLYGWYAFEKVLEN